MNEVWPRRLRIAILGTALACLPIELAVSGAILAIIVFVDHMFDTRRMLGDRAVERMQE
ncbi:hypothetical protein [Martelella limonii]|uniref:hypothetical protein n=1 Tax=Martelella limonii TaxID=1647649 RepID=UPI0015800185|nr:hypothetical protein [Martelella limonii]